MDPIFGIHASALLLRSQRMDVLATNLANADTPHYKARDFDFAAALDRAAGRGGLRVTHRRHIGGASSTPPAELAYRVPHQPAVDGNTVEADLELARFAENSVAYQASLAFIDGRISTLRLALTGGR